MPALAAPSSADVLKLPPVAYPGLYLGPTSTHSAGPGTHIHNSHIYASIAGQPTIFDTSSTDSTIDRASEPQTSASKIPESRSKPQITVPRILPSPIHAPVTSTCVTNNTPLLPQVGHVVLARVVRVRVRQVDVVILCIQDPGSRSKFEAEVGNSEGRQEALKGRRNGLNKSAGTSEWVVCKDEWPATVRKEDIRATEKDKVICAEGFRVGDVIRGGVVSPVKFPFNCAFVAMRCGTRCSICPTTN